MRLKIVGSAAGGGFPQWNCNYRLSRAARMGSDGVRERTQSSLAVSANGRDWVLFNASPDIREQIAKTRELQPGDEDALRSTPIRAVVLTNADVDHIAGLLSLRERQPFAIYASSQVLATLEANPIFSVLIQPLFRGGNLPSKTNSTSWMPITVQPAYALRASSCRKDTALHGASESARRRLQVVAARYDCRPYIRRQWLGLLSSIFQVAQASTRTFARALTDASCLLFDGTVYTDDEMITAGVGQKTGARMGHLAMAGEAARSPAGWCNMGVAFSFTSIIPIRFSTRVRTNTHQREPQGGRSHMTAWR